MKDYKKAIEYATRAMEKIDEAANLLVQAKQEAGYNDRGCEVINAYCTPYLMAVAGHDEGMITMGNIQDAIEHWAGQIEGEKSFGEGTLILKNRFIVSFIDTYDEDDFTKKLKEFKEQVCFFYDGADAITVDHDLDTLEDDLLYDICYFQEGTGEHMCVLNASKEVILSTYIYERGIVAYNILKRQFIF